MKLRLLQKYTAHLVTAYSLQWIPGQGDDIVTYLINADLVAIVETERYDASIEPIIETMSITQYMIGLCKSHRIKLAVALDMARKDMGLNQS
ncbi:hypothetical protein M3194_13915 [Paenibacillus glycanilyticus]|uniref:hypothetical protein n=1 Tax=Paenibacillus glycanilyticus TaxID=126569 RepID=UPI00203E5935|nr:hypothetical protein [Paenibacillus glycanilyticus]MCM3628458.1 hypothetical protein [Paenibacillus glycanilyticus]